jgi:hypothetical protein
MTWRGRGAARRLRLPDRIVSSLSGATEAVRLRPRTIRRELHHRRIAGRCRVHQRPLSDRQRVARDHATSRYLLSRGHSDEPASDAGITDIERTAMILPLCCPAGSGRRRDRRPGVLQKTKLIHGRRNLVRTQTVSSGCRTKSSRTPLPRTLRVNRLRCPKQCSVRSQLRAFRSQPRTRVEVEALVVSDRGTGPDDQSQKHSASWQNV